MSVKLVRVQVVPYILPKVCWDWLQFSCELQRISSILIGMDV